jgi:hypothetical protein
MDYLRDGMNIKKTDSSYLEDLRESLVKARKGGIPAHFCQRSQQEERGGVSKIKIKGVGRFDGQGTDRWELISMTLMKKA